MSLGGTGLERRHQASGCFLYTADLQWICTPWGGPLNPHGAPESVAKDLTCSMQPFLTLKRQSQAAPQRKGSANSLNHSEEGTAPFNNFRSLCLGLNSHSPATMSQRFKGKSQMPSKHSSFKRQIEKLFSFFLVTFNKFSHS